MNPTRLLPACLHQAIADVLPMRLEYYEEWLDPVDLRNGRVGLAPLTAVFGFLRTEGLSYGTVMARAGELAAEWTLGETPAFSRRVTAALPVSLRSRMALRLASRLARQLPAAGETRLRVRRGEATLSVSQSLFCGARAPVAVPLCDFYRTLAVAMLRGFGVASAARIEQCRAVSGGPCVIVVAIAGAQTQPPAAAA